MADCPDAPLYDSIGLNYDSTRRPDPYIASRLAHHLRPADGGRFLDIACGTGNYTAELAKLGGSWHALDMSERMLRAAQQKSHHISLLLGDALSLPFRDGSFDGVLCSNALHHFAALLPAFQEAYRVIGRGRLVIFTATSEQTGRFWLNEYFPEAIDRAARQTPPLDSVLAALEEAGFNPAETELYEVQPDLKDLFLYSGKHRPELYLSAAVRQGISAFSTLAGPCGSGLRVWLTPKGHSIGANQRSDKPLQA